MAYFENFSNSFIEGTIRFRYENETSKMRPKNILGANKYFDGLSLVVICSLIFIFFLILVFVFFILKYKKNIKSQKKNNDLFEMNLIFS